MPQSQEILNKVEGAFRHVPDEGVAVTDAELRAMLARVTRMIWQKVKVVQQATKQEAPRLRVYLAVPRRVWRGLFVNGDPEKGLKKDLQAWQRALAGLDFDAPVRRHTLEGAKEEAAIFELKLTADEAVELVRWCAAHPKLAAGLQDSLRLADPEKGVSGLEAFVKWLNSNPDWTPKEPENV